MSAKTEKRHSCIACGCPLSHRDSIEAGLCAKDVERVRDQAGHLLLALDDLFTAASIACGELSGNSIVVDELARVLHHARVVRARARAQ